MRIKTKFRRMPGYSVLAVMFMIPVFISADRMTALSSALAQSQKQAPSIVPIPSPLTILDMARSVQFDNIAVTDELVPLTDESAPSKARGLDPTFTIKVYFRSGIDNLKYRPEVGAIFARLLITGVPAKRLLPDGEYYLWMGGNGELTRAALVKLDGALVKEVEVLAKPSVEVSTAETAKVLSVIDEPALMNRSSTQSPRVPPKLPPNQPRKDPPPKDPPPKDPPPPGRTWREVRVPWTLNPDGSTPPPRWVRVPDN